MLLNFSGQRIPIPSCCPLGQRDPRRGGCRHLRPGAYVPSLPRDARAELHSSRDGVCVMRRRIQFTESVCAGGSG